MAEADGVGPLGAPLPGAMPNRLPENAPAPDFDPKAVAKGLLRVTRAGALATIDRNTGHPFASLVNVATDVDGSPLILVSRLSDFVCYQMWIFSVIRRFPNVHAGPFFDPAAFSRLELWMPPAQRVVRRFPAFSSNRDRKQLPESAGSGARRFDECARGR